MRSYPPFFSAGLTAAALAAVGALCLYAPGRTSAGKKPAQDASVIKRPALSFEANRGQTDSTVRFLSRGPGYTMLLKGNEAVVRFSRKEKDASTRRATVSMKLAGSKASPRVLARSKQAGVVNYYHGNDPKKWLQGVPTYPRVAFGDVYPGIDVEYYGRQGQLEYDFQVHPQGDPTDIRMSLNGVSAASLDGNGDLRMETPAGTLVQQRPILYQMVDGTRRGVAGAYALSHNAAGTPEVSFEVSDYDRNRTLVIDPVLIYASFLGGSKKDLGYAIAAGSDGTAYVTGATESTNFPMQAPFQGAPVAGIEAFVTKIAADGESVVFSTYIGGNGREESRGIAVDPDGDVYIAGLTDSSNFPTLNPFQGTKGQVTDVFVTRLAADGGSLGYSTYYGGKSFDEAYAIAFSGDKRVAITGKTDSDDLPVSTDAFDKTWGTLDDAFVAKFDTAKAGSESLVAATYLGDASNDIGFGIAVDSAGNSYVGGSTSGQEFPTTNGAFDTTYNGQVRDVFVSKVSTDCKNLIYSTFVGGNQQDECRGIAIDSSGSAYVTGSTLSEDFPTTQGAYDRIQNGFLDPFVTKLTPDGSGLVYSTFVGGSLHDNFFGGAIAVDTEGNAFITGDTISDDFPQFFPFQSDYGGGISDAFVTKLKVDGDGLLYSSFLGGESRDEGLGIAVDPAGNCYVTGKTDSANQFPTTVGAFQGGFGGDLDGWVAKIEAVTAGPPAAPVNLTATALSNTQIRLEWTDESANEDGFEIERKIGGPGAAGSFAPTGAVGRNVTEYTDIGLDSNTTYSYRVRATNTNGDSAYSNVASATTLPRPPDRPTDLIVTPLSATSIKLTWRDNSSNETRFRIERSSNNGVSYSFVGTAGANVTQYTDLGLESSTLYWYRVRAENTGGNSAFSNAASGMTFPTSPAPPTELTGEPLTYASVRLQWVDKSANELEFQIFRAGATGDFAQVGRTRTDINTFTDSGLIADTEYRYKVRAVNDGGASAFTDIIKVRTPVNPPASPVALHAEVQSDGVQLSWHDESNDETAFRVQRALVAPIQAEPDFTVIASTAANVSTYKDKTAATDSKYLYRVVAAKGTSLSLPSNVVEVVTVPTAPAELSGSEISQHSVLLKWADKSKTETGFRVEKKIGGKTAAGDFATVTTVGVNITSLRVEGLNADSLYTFRVGALSSGNVANYSDLLEVRTLGETPGAPTELKANGLSSSSIRLEWLDNSANEKRFEIQRSLDGGASFTPLAEVGANVKAYTDEGLLPEKSYTYRVRAANDGGASAFSNNATGRTKPSAPGVPTRLAITEPSVSTLKASWRDEGGKATGFELQRKKTDGDFVTIANLGADARQFVDRGLAPNAAYKYRIRAKNDGGLSAYSDEASGLTLPKGPRDLTATATGPRKIDLKWIAGSTAAGFAIERHSQADLSFQRVATVGGDKTAYSDQNLPAGAKLTYRVRAFNDSGESEASNEASASTEVALVELTVNPTQVRGGRKSRGRVVLSGPAPAGGIVVTLASSKPRKASVPKSVNIAQGATVAEFTIETTDVRSTIVVTISASAKGVRKEALLTLKR